jgi:hypothetical protein
MPDEVLNGELFHSVLEAKVVLNSWVINTTPFVRIVVSVSKHPTRFTRHLKWAGDERLCPQSLWTSPEPHTRLSHLCAAKCQIDY